MTILDSFKNAVLRFKKSPNASSQRRAGAFSLYGVRSVLPYAVLGLFLVGSCKTSELPGNYNAENETRLEYSATLFPDFLKWRDGDRASPYVPARGYLRAARSYVTQTPERLVSLSEHEITAMFGEPEIRRVEDPARIWQYRSADCVLDLYLYSENRAQTGFVAHYELRGFAERAGGHAPVLKREQKLRCLSRIAASRRFASHSI